ncbi:MAG: DEAD/DEAH box helicase family protein [Sedimentisphaerales bacterium]
MSQGKIDHLIINSPFEEPKLHWFYHRESRKFEKRTGRRPAGYITASPDSRGFDDPGIFNELPLVNQIRQRVKKWREQNYPGTTGITKRLLEHWNDKATRQYPLFFCQIEAIETLIWLTEAPAAEKTGIDIPSDGGGFTRLCSKMATGSGKTIVMAMLIAWQVLNKITYPQDTRFSKNVLIIAPGLTVKSRLGVLVPDSAGNFYDEFGILPTGLYEKIRQGKVVIHNWHILGWDTEEQIAKKRTVDKRGVKSDEAYVREVLGDMANAQNIIVINDEAHHAWRSNPEAIGKYLRQRDMKDSAEEATIWVGGLDRVHRARGILTCFDFSATPFAPSGKQSTEENLFGWVVSDFGLNDAIESGLVKTPRVVVRDDALPNVNTYKPKLYHIYPEVKDDICRKAEPEEPLPDLIMNGYTLLGADWLETAKLWEQIGRTTPPVMITVANMTYTAARVKYAFDHKRVKIDELCVPEKTLHIDSRVLEIAESQDEPVASVDENGESSDETETPEKKLTRKELAEKLRQAVDTIGKKGKAGEQIQNVISVGMLSEGWDAKTVTHIMGLRAFTSQLLCEQVVGRGLRRTSYDDFDENKMFKPEYVNIFGVPFTFLPHEAKEDDGGPPPPPQPKTAIEPVSEKKEFEISWPNIIRIEAVYKPRLILDWDKVKPLELNAFDTPQVAEMAPIVDGKPDLSKISEIDLQKLGEKYRYQRIIFEAAAENYERMSKSWKGNKQNLLAQLIKIVEQFISSGKIQIIPSLFHQDDFKKRIILTLNMNKVVQHIADAIRQDNIETLEPVFDSDRPIRSTADMRTWYTSKPCEPAKKSHINFCVFDSTWEATEAFQLDRSKNVNAWVKNDHLGFDITYIFKGIVKKYWPDFLIKLTNGEYLILETKGQESAEDKTKRQFLAEWVRAVNEKGGFGKWKSDVSYNPSDISDILDNAFTA